MKLRKVYIAFTLAFLALLIGAPLPTVTSEQAQSVAPGQVPDDLSAADRGATQDRMTQTDPLAYRLVARPFPSDSMGVYVFGYATSLSGDTLVVGDPGYGHLTPSATGAAFVFYRDHGGTDAWGGVARLTPPDGMMDDEFGTAVSADGDIVVVGAWNAAVGGAVEQGAAYVFSRNQGGADAWGFVSKLTAFDGEHHDNFGWAVSVSGDTIVVGLSGMSGEQRKGEAYIFNRDPASGAWLPGPTPKLTAFDGTIVDGFGQSVSVSGDTIIVGAPYADIGGITDQGAAYVFSRHPVSGVWTPGPKLIASEGFTNSYFGRAVSVSGDTAVVSGLAAAGATYVGAAYVFYHDLVSDSWQQVAQLLGSNDRSTAGYWDWFGTSISLTGDTVVVGAPYATIDGRQYNGAAYIFSRNQGGANHWGRVDKRVGDTALEGFGSGVSVSGNTVAVGAWGGGSLHPEGEAFVYGPSFQPDPDGYSFRNIKRPVPAWTVFEQTFANSDLRDPDGFPKPLALLFYDTIYRKAFFAGVCDGMSSTSLAYYESVETRPGGATTTFALSPGAAWPLIDLYHGRQLSEGLQNYRNNLWHNYPGVDGIYSQLKAQLPTATNDPVVMSFVPGLTNSIPKSQSFGHSVVPYRFEEQAGAWGKIYVYDPNFPADSNRYFYFNFQTNPHSFDYEMGFPIPSGSGGNYHVQSGDGWVIYLTPLSQNTGYDAKILSDKFIIGWLDGAGEVVHTNSIGQQLGYVQGVLTATIPNSAPMYQWVSPDFQADALGFSLPTDDYRAAINYTGDYEYMAGSLTTTVDLRVQGIGGTALQMPESSSGLDYIQLDAQQVSATYSSTLSANHALSLQLAGSEPLIARRYGILNATMPGPGRLHGEALSNGFYLQTSGMTSTFDLDIQGRENNRLGWFVHRGITMTASAVMTIEAPTLSASSVVTVSVASSPGGPVEHVWILENQVQRVYLPIVMK